MMTRALKLFLKDYFPIKLKSEDRDFIIFFISLFFLALLLISFALKK